MRDELSQAIIDTAADLKRTAPSSLRAELAEAKAEIARLERLADRNTHTLDARSARIYQMERIVEAARAFVKGWHPVDRRDADALYGALESAVAAVEEGQRP